MIKTICDSVNHTRFPKQDHLPDGACRDNKVKKSDRVETDTANSTICTQFGDQFRMSCREITQRKEILYFDPTTVTVFEKWDTTERSRNVITACLRAMEEQFQNGLLNTMLRRLRLKCDGTCAETRFRLSAKRTSPFKSAVASVQSTTGSRGVRISGSNAGYNMFRGSVKGTGYPLHSPVSPSLPPSCVTVCHHISTGVYNKRFSILIPPSPPALQNCPVHVSCSQRRKTCRF